MSNADTSNASANILTTSILEVPSFSIRRKFLTVYPTVSATYCCVQLLLSLKVLIVRPIKRESINLLIPTSFFLFIWRFNLTIRSVVLYERYYYILNLFNMSRKTLFILHFIFHYYFRSNVGFFNL